MNATTLREMMGKATPTPWILHNEEFLCTVQVGEAYMPAPYQPPHGRGECPQQRADGRLIVAAVNLFGPLLDVLEAAEGLPAPRHREYCPCSDWPDRECDCGALDERSALNDAIAALYRRAGEVMG